MNLKKYKIKVVIICFILIVLSLIGGVYNLIYYSYKTNDIICNKRFPLYHVESLSVDDKDNFYIGSLDNAWIQVFGSEGEYKFTINSHKTTSFYTDEDGLIHIFSYQIKNDSNKYDDKDMQCKEDIIDMKEKKIISTKYHSTSKLDDLLSINEIKKYEKYGKTYKYFFNRIIVKGKDSKEIIKLKDVPLFPLGIGVYFITIGICVLMIHIVTGTFSEK